MTTARLERLKKGSRRDTDYPAKKGSLPIPNDSAGAQDSTCIAFLIGAKCVLPDDSHRFSEMCVGNGFAS